MKYSLKFWLIIPLALIYSQLYAVPASPYPVKITQPDGSCITVVLKGDEHFSYHTSPDGYPLIKNKNGVFNYAIADKNGKLTDTAVKASDVGKRNNSEKSFLKNIPKDFISSANISLTRNRIKSAANRAMEKPAKFPLIGTPRSLVILVNFSNLAFVTPNPQVAFTSLLNQPNYSANGGTGSAKDYFRDNSMGVFNPRFDVVGPYTLPQPYSYYGGNDTDGNDQNPAQMVADACRLASQDGVDFSIYDTDGNNYVDNVFVYYAGHNEAEHAPAETVWPHRWGVYPGNNYNGSAASITFNGKRVMDYACTSELRSNTGANMCGIGTFCHEFGHVLGLTDMYATDGSTHQTLSDWDVMDNGPYLNLGRTPPAYSSYQRFSLRWLTPAELNKAQDVNLEMLTTSNKAYLITQNGDHNLNGVNPSPTEFFMLENRQKNGWDAYLPGHGLLITRVNYSASDWNNNTPNNNPNRMGVDIIEADGIASNNTLAGDPFPGSMNINYCVLKLRSGVDIKNPITDVKEKNNVVSFKFMGGVNKIPAPTAYESTEITDRSFIANWEKVDEATGYYLTVFTLDEKGDTIYAEKKDKKYNNLLLANNTETIYNLISNRTYQYYLKSSEKNAQFGYEHISISTSNTINVQTLPYTSKKLLRAVVNQAVGEVKVFVPAKGDVVNVYNILGQKVMSDTSKSDIFSITGLPRNQVYIIESGKYRVKVIMR